MLEEIAAIISEKAIEIASQEVSKYVMDNPGTDISEDLRNLVKDRALAQITFNVSKLRIRDKDNLTEEVNTWFTETEEEQLRKTCKECIKTELAKLHKDEDPNMSFLDRYRMEHRYKTNLSK